MVLDSAPEAIGTELFTAAPDEIRRGPGRTDSFLEGPSFDVQGNLYCVDIPHGRVLRISPDGRWQVAAEYDGRPNGLKIHRDGRIFIADRRNGLVVLDPASGDVRTVLSGPGRQERFMGLNDLVFAANGDLYFTDQGQSGLHDPCGRVYRYSPQADRLECLIANAPSPNGLVFNVRETALFVAVTRANAVWRIPLGSPAGEADDWKPRTIDAVGLFVQLPSAGPDGLALDEAGNVVVTHPTRGLVWLFSKYGVPLLRIASCAKEMTTNVAYGGADGRTLYIVESKSCSILTARMPVAGKRMYSHGGQ